MKRERMEYRKPYGRGDYDLHRGERGVYWEAGHGLVVRLAAPERERHTPAAGTEIVHSENGPTRFAR